MNLRLALFSLAWAAIPASALEIAPFSADVTPPVGHQLFTGGAKEAVAVDSPLLAKGFVLTDAKSAPVVFVSVDWAEIRNDAYDRWREVLAEAAGTERIRVLVTSIHQHDTPLPDLEAQRILDAAGADTQLIDPDFHERALQKAAGALREALKSKQTVTHLGTGEAEVKEVASNRRFVDPQGKVSYGRYSGGGSLASKMAGVGTIDPLLKTLSFWDGEDAICALSVYATHPMSYYRTARISADFPGLAREKRQAETPKTLQIYASGASGNVTVGKFNNGKPEMRPIFAERLHTAMNQAWQSTKKLPVPEMSFRSEPLTLAPRLEGNFTPEALQNQLTGENSNRMRKGMAALGISWQKRVVAGQPIDVPLIELGPAKLLLLPAEIYVEYQLFAQELAPDDFVVAVGYGECGPGYIPVERAWEEKDQNLGDWAWVAPGAEKPVKDVIRKLLQPGG